MSGECETIGEDRDIEKGMSTKIGGMVIKKGLAGGGKGSTRSDAFTRGGTWAEGG